MPKFTVTIVLLDHTYVIRNVEAKDENTACYLAKGKLMNKIEATAVKTSGSEPFDFLMDIVNGK